MIKLRCKKFCLWVHAKSLQSCPILCDPMDCSLQAPLSMGFSRQEYWTGLPFSPPGDLSDPGIEPKSLVSSALVGVFFITDVTWEAPYLWVVRYNFFKEQFRFNIRKKILLRVTAIQLWNIHLREECKPHLSRPCNQKHPKQTGDVMGSNLLTRT